MWAHFIWTDKKHFSYYYACSISSFKIRLFSSQFCQCPAWSWRSTPWISVRLWQRVPMRLRPLIKQHGLPLLLEIASFLADVHADNSFYSKMVAKSSAAKTSPSLFRNWTSCSWQTSMRTIASTPSWSPSAAMTQVRNWTSCCWCRLQELPWFQSLAAHLSNLCETEGLPWPCFEAQGWRETVSSVFCWQVCRGR